MTDHKSVFLMTFALPYRRFGKTPLNIQQQSDTR